MTIRRFQSGLLLLPLAFLPGCLHRTITVTSEPPGAVVTLNDVEIGRTPVDTDFTFYGTYDVRLRLEGYEPILTKRKAKAPIYEYPVFDLIAEAIPARIHTQVDWHFDLKPVAESIDPEAAKEQLLERAGQLRSDVQAGAYDSDRKDKKSP